MVLNLWFCIKSPLTWANVRNKDVTILLPSEKLQEVLDPLKKELERALAMESKKESIMVWKAGARFSFLKSPFSMQGWQ